MVFDWYADDRFKGEVMAWRMALLYKEANRAMPHPASVLRRYVMRSGVAHGSALGAAREADYRSMRNMAMECLGLLLDLASRRGMMRRRDLLRLLENAHDLKEVSTWLQQGWPGDKQSKRIVDDIRRVIGGPAGGS